MSKITFNCPEQEEHFKRLDHMLENRTKFCIDGSVPGSGKTYVHARMSYVSDLQLMVIGSVSASHTWKTLCEKYKIPLIFITYSSLASKKDFQPSHGYLKRKEDGKKGIFTATNSFKDLVDKGVYLVLDECQEVKNKSSRFYACKALCDEIMAQKTISRFALLSGTSTLTHKHTVNYMRFIGYIKDHFLYRNDVNTGFELKGAAELIENCRRMNPDGLNKFIETDPIPDDV